MWMLCVVLHHLHTSRTCWPVETEARCLEIQRDWGHRSYAWSIRSKLPPQFLSACVPPDEVSRELIARERPPR
jgi:hypothetical protein